MDVKFILHRVFLSLLFLLPVLEVIGKEPVDISRSELNVFSLRGMHSLGAAGDLECFYGGDGNGLGFILYSWERYEVLHAMSVHYADVDYPKFALSPDLRKIAWHLNGQLYYADLISRESWVLGTFDEYAHRYDVPIVWSFDSARLVLVTTSNGQSRYRVYDLEGRVLQEITGPTSELGNHLLVDKVNQVLRTPTGSARAWLQDGTLSAEAIPPPRGTKFTSAERISPSGNRWIQYEFPEDSGAAIPVYVLDLGSGDTVTLSFKLSDLYEIGQVRWLNASTIHFRNTATGQHELFDATTGEAVQGVPIDPYDPRPDITLRLISGREPLEQIRWFGSGEDGRGTYSSEPYTGLSSVQGVSDPVLSPLNGRMRYRGMEQTQWDGVVDTSWFPWIRGTEYFDWLFLTADEPGWQWAFWPGEGWVFLTTMERVDGTFWFYHFGRSSWMQAHSEAKDPWLWFDLSEKFWVDGLPGNAPWSLAGRSLHFELPGSDGSESWSFFSSSRFEIKAQSRDPDTGQLVPIHAEGDYIYDRTGENAATLAVSGFVEGIFPFEGELELSYTGEGKGTVAADLTYRIIPEAPTRILETAGFQTSGIRN